MSFNQTVSEAIARRSTPGSGSAKAPDDRPLSSITEVRSVSCAALPATFYLSSCR